MELLPHCAKTQWHAFGHDLFSAAGGKQQAFAATLARYGLTPAQCMAFGDSDNDIGLLTAAGIGVAMEAGTDGARARGFCHSRLRGGRHPLCAGIFFCTVINILDQGMVVFSPAQLCCTGGNG